MEEELTPGTELLTLNAIRVEAALSRYPIHRLARKGNIRIEVSDGNRETALLWKVSYNSEYGQPGPLAYKLDTLIINRRIEESYRPIPRLIKLGSLHDICKELGVSEGKNKSAIKQSLYQNASAFITAKIHYKSANGAERVLESGFNRYSVIFTGEKLPDGRKADGVYIILNDVFIQVINGAMTRPLDYDYLKSLPPAPQRFYELLSYQMYAALKNDRPRAKLTYSNLCDHAPQTRHLDWDKVRSQMNKIHRPHRESGYIAKVDFQQTTDHDGNADWIMFYQPGLKARAEFKAFTKRGGPSVVEIEPEPMPLLDQAYKTELESELIQRGVSSAVAADLVRNHSEDRIRSQIEQVDWLVAAKPKKVADPAAYLVRAIKEDFAAPKNFVSKAEAELLQITQKAREQQEAGERRARLAKEAAELAEQKRIDAYWAKLSPREQAAIDALADPSTLALPEGPLRRIGLHVHHVEHIRQLLNGQTVASFEA